MASSLANREANQLLTSTSRQLGKVAMQPTRLLRAKTGAKTECQDRPRHAGGKQEAGWGGGAEGCLG